MDLSVRDEADDDDDALVRAGGEASLTKVEEEEDDRDILPNIEQDSSVSSADAGRATAKMADTPISKSDEEQTFSRTARTNGPAVDSI